MMFSGWWFGLCCCTQEGESSRPISPAPNAYRWITQSFLKCVENQKHKSILWYTKRKLIKEMIVVIKWNVSAKFMCTHSRVTISPLTQRHHHISLMELDQSLTRSGPTYQEVSSKVCHDSFCLLGNSVSLLWVIYYEAFYLHIVSSFSYIQVIFPKLVLFLVPLQMVYLFCDLSECILLFFSCISSLLLLLFLRPLL